jgi:hypothetical protein
MMAEGLISIHFHHSLAFVRPALQADTVREMVFTTGLALDKVLQRQCIMCTTTVAAAL